jgi:Cyclic nucleotide-binding domain
MHRPDDFHETPDEQRPPQARPDSAPADRGGTRSGLTFSIKFEIGRSGPLLGRMRVERQARPAIANRIRGMLCRVLGEGLEPRRQSPTSPAGDRGSRLEEADADPPREPVVSRQARVSFWETLNPVERRALESLASWVRFPVGDTIMREGEPADYVLVIIEGRTRICVDENGWERILAERGPGDLVGERAGFQVRVRSASVIAAETVRALKVKTADFTAFVVDHPRVLNIVEDQLYGRLTEDAIGSLGNRGPGAMSSQPASGRSTIVRPGEQLTPGNPPLLNGHHCTILFSDVVAFGAATRNDKDRRVIREELLRMTHATLRNIPAEWSWDDRGDGLLIIVPPSVPTADVIEQLFNELPSRLDEHNNTHRKSAQIQLRLAVHVGPVTTDAMGVSGEAIIVAARLVEAQVFKDAIAKNAAVLGVITSTFVYESTIRHCEETISLRAYSQVQVDVKELCIPAWIKLFYPPPVSYPAVGGSYRGLLRLSDCSQARSVAHRRQRRAASPFTSARARRSSARQQAAGAVQGFPEVGLRCGVVGLGH